MKLCLSARMFTPPGNRNAFNLDLKDLIELVKELRKAAETWPGNIDKRWDQQFNVDRQGTTSRTS